MSELLTTGQMIDRLKIGEVAKLEGTTTNFVHRTSEGYFHGTRNAHKSYDPLMIIHDVPNYTRWRILPNHVSFDKAMEALKDGKRVSFTYKNEDGFEEAIYIEPHYGAKSSLRREIEWKDLFETKWTIEE